MSFTPIKVVYTKDDKGVVFPYKVCWQDGRCWDVTRVIHTCVSPVDFAGTRYTVKIGQAIKYIYRIEEDWFVDQVP